VNIGLTMLSQAVAFAIFIWFTIKFIWPPLMKAIEQRQRQIAEGLAAAERGKQDLELAAKRAAEELQRARTQAGEIISQAEKRGAAVVEEAKSAAKFEAQRIVTGAKAEIEQEVFRAKEALRTQVAVLAVAGAEKILKREVDAKAHAQLLSGLEAEFK
jgi:F-type H+-transporting ATPase subunit b